MALLNEYRNNGNEGQAQWLHICVLLCVGALEDCFQEILLCLPVALFPYQLTGGTAL